MLGRLLLLLLLLGLALAGCSTPVPDSATEAPSSRTLLEEKLLAVLEAEQRLDEVAAAPEADRLEVQRLFHQVDREYAGIIARNPDHLESRLLYGKLLSRYGDREGARNQFLEAAHLDPAVAVIHQELSTYYAEEEDYTRALAYALNAIRLEPRQAAYHFGLGQLLAAFREPFVEEEVFTQAQIDEDMLAAFRTAAELEPQTLALQFRLGEAFYDLSSPDWEAALAHWEQLSGHPDLSALQQDAVRLHRARCLIGLGQTEAARELADAVESEELRPSAQSLLEESP